MLVVIHGETGGSSERQTAGRCGAESPTSRQTRAGGTRGSHSHTDNAARRPQQPRLRRARLGFSSFSAKLVCNVMYIQVHRALSLRSGRRVGCSCCASARARGTRGDACARAPAVGGGPLAPRPSQLSLQPTPYTPPPSRLLSPGRPGGRAQLCTSRECDETPSGTRYKRYGRFQRFHSVGMGTSDS